MIANSLSLLAVGNDLWYALPLVIVISLVYAATRHESNDQILVAAGRTAPGSADSCSPSSWSWP